MKPHPLQPNATAATETEMRAAFIGEMPKLNGQIALLEHDPQWFVWFEREAVRLRGLLGERILALDHVGSTAVPGLVAKPIIDMDLTLADSSHESEYVPILESAGYRLLIREPDWEEHRMFKGPDNEINLHVWSLGSAEAQRHLIFRDWLRNNLEDRERYGQLKRTLVTQEFAYMHEYNNAKAPLIREIYTHAFTALKNLW